MATKTKTAAAKKLAAKAAKTVTKPAAAKKAAPAPKPVAEKAGWGDKSQVLHDLFVQKNGATAAEIKVATGWKSVSAKALADRFAITWGKVENESAEGERDGAPHKVVKVDRKDGTVAYRWA